jgi:hypothetical protein
MVKLASPLLQPDRVFLSDVNGDKTPDLIVGAVNKAGGKALEVHVASGYPDGTYGTNLQLPPDSKTKPLYVGLSGHLLAVGDLDADTNLDVVTSEGIYFATDLGQGKAMPSYRPGLGDAWSDAVIGDFNGNGAPDIITGQSDSENLDFYNGVPASMGGGHVFNLFRIPTEGGTGLFSVGDYDGDLLPDLAFAESASSVLGADDGQRYLSVVFGRSAGAPEDPTRVGRFEMGIEQITSLSVPLADPDAIAELGVVAVRPSDEDPSKMAWTISAIQGSSDRQLQAPLLLGDVTSPQLDLSIPLRAFVGRFDPGNKGDASRDLALITYGNQAGPEKPMALWQIPVGQGVSLTLDSPPPADYPTQLFNGMSVPLDQSAVQIINGVVADLNGDGLDELVLTLPRLDTMPPRVGLYVMSPGDKDKFTLPKDALFEAEDTGYTSLRAADVDEDGHVDIVAVKITVTRDGNKVSFKDSTPIVFWGDGNGNLGTPTEAPPPGKSDICEVADKPSRLRTGALAVLEAGLTDAQRAAAKQQKLEGAAMSTLNKTREIALIDASGAYLVEVDARKLSSPRCIAKSPGGQAIEAVDLTGDGVDDLVIGAPGSTYLLRGLPEQP